MDDAVFVLQQELGALVAGRLPVGEIFQDAVQKSLIKVKENLGSWQKLGLRKKACSGVEGSSVELIRITICRDETDELGDELCLLFDTVLKLVKTPEVLPKVREVHGLVLEKLQLAEGASLHKKLMDLLSQFEAPVSNDQLKVLLGSLQANLLSKPALPADILDKLERLGKVAIQKVGWAFIQWDGYWVVMFHRFFSLPHINVSGDMEVFTTFFHGLAKVHNAAAACRESIEAAGLDLARSLLEEFIVCIRNADKPPEACQDQEVHRAFVGVHDLLKHQFVQPHRDELQETAKTLIAALVESLAEETGLLEQVAGGGSGGKAWTDGCGPLPGDVVAHYDATLGKLDTRQVAKHVGRVTEVALFSNV